MFKIEIQLGVIGLDPIGTHAAHWAFAGCGSSRGCRPARASEPASPAPAARKRERHGVYPCARLVRTDGFGRTQRKDRPARPHTSPHSPRACPRSHTTASASCSRSSRAAMRAAALWCLTVLGQLHAHDGIEYRWHAARRAPPLSNTAACK